MKVPGWMSISFTNVLVNAGWEILPMPFTGEVEQVIVERKVDHNISNVRLWLDNGYVRADARMYLDDERTTQIDYPEFAVVGDVLRLPKTVNALRAIHGFAKAQHQFAWIQPTLTGYHDARRAALNALYALREEGGFPFTQDEGFDVSKQGEVSDYEEQRSYAAAAMVRVLYNSPHLNPFHTEQESIRRQRNGR